MAIALSGTPGVGKTTVSQILKERGHLILDINEIVEDNDFVEGYDKERDTNIIDIEALNRFVQKNYQKKNIIIEGHLSHLLSVDFSIILRCDPLVLNERLNAKEWPEKKIKENVGAEILDVIKVEALENMDRVYEVNTTSLTPEEAADTIEDILKGKYEEPHINWLDRYDYLLF